MTGANSMNLERIARLAGVSRSTVSRVINGYPHVREEIRSRVLAVIEREGFQANAAARMLARQRTDVIGVVEPEGLGSVFSKGYFNLLFEGISMGINPTDYAMSLWIGSTPEETERINKRILGYKMMDGVLIISSMTGETLAQRLVERKMPVVMIGNSSTPGVLTIDIDNIAAARMATNHLVRLGRQRIAHITGRTSLISARERLTGYREAIETTRQGFDPALVIEADYSPDAGYWATRQLISTGIDAIFAGSDLIGIGAIRALHEQQIAIPGDVAVVGFDDLPAAATLKPSLTTVRQPIRELGRLAVQSLIDLIDGRITAAHRVILPTELIVRESCGALNHLNHG
ncbi:MAG TPA: LacI family DNA-binding transcriptional regulator [Aggregatilineales bacterium]|nr:LacI family DNA-binding transcriptional regulator [Aggregatilineales bacterium]